MEAIVTEQDVTNGQSEVDGSSGVSVVRLSIPNQPVQVQSVIQPSPSVIQATGPGLQTIQVQMSSDDEEAGGKRRREILARRPSYRKILNELSSDAPVISVQRIDEESNSSPASQESQEASDAAQNLSATQTNTVQIQNADGTSSFAVLPAGALQLSGNSDITTSQGLQTITMSNVTSVNTPTTGTTIVQYAQGPDGQFYIPAGSMQAYQISTPSLPQGVVMATAGSTIGSQQQVSEETSRKRELRLLKNREAAKECRRKKKDYVKCLENRVAVLENQNKALIEELKSLKELYCQKDVIGQ